MKLTTLVVFGAGYVIGTKAGRERYAQIVTVAQKASKRLDEYSARHQADTEQVVDSDSDRSSQWEESAF